MIETFYYNEPNDEVKKYMIEMFRYTKRFNKLKKQPISIG